MKRNFEFDGFSVIRWGDRSIDLHNDYELESLGSDITGSEARLAFTQIEHAEGLPSKVTLTCTGNVTVAFNDLRALERSLQHEGIDLAYFAEDCDWQSFIDEEMARSQAPLGLHLGFSPSDLTIRIFCDEARLATE